MDTRTNTELAAQITAFAKEVWGEGWQGLNPETARQQAKCPMTERQVIEVLLVSQDKQAIHLGLLTLIVTRMLVLWGEHVNALFICSYIERGCPMLNNRFGRLPNAGTWTLYQ
eukprot:5296744-Pyramimonas_sp.AAC.2